MIEAQNVTCTFGMESSTNIQFPQSCLPFSDRTSSLLFVITVPNLACSPVFKRAAASWRGKSFLYNTADSRTYASPGQLPSSLLSCFQL